MVPSRSLPGLFRLFAVLAAGLQGGVAHAQPAAVPALPKAAHVEDGIAVYFSPGGGCTDAIVQHLNRARRTVQVQAYSFTSAPIAKALLDAHKRGVKVTAILDASQRTAQYSSATFLLNAGIPVYIDDKHAIAHNKIILIDGQTVITGSFNFTKAAEQSNAENLLIIQGRPGLYSVYDKNFRAHLSHAVKYEGATPAGRSQLQEQSEDSGGMAQPEVTAPARSPRTSQAAADNSRMEAPPAAVDTIVHVTRTGKKYHREGCPSLARSDIPMKIPEARAKGYTPCARCKPVD